MPDLLTAYLVVAGIALPFALLAVWSGVWAFREMAKIVDRAMDLVEGREGSSDE